MNHKVSALLPVVVIALLSIVAGYQWLLDPARTTTLLWNADYTYADIASHVFCILVTSLVSTIACAFLIPSARRRVFPRTLDRLLWLFGVSVQIFIVFASATTLFLSPDDDVVRASFTALVDYLPALVILAVNASILTQLSFCTREYFPGVVIKIASFCFMATLAYEFFYIFMFLYESQLQNQPIYDAIALGALVVLILSTLVLCVPLSCVQRWLSTTETSTE